jgi:hypothetical protein
MTHRARGRNTRGTNPHCTFLPLARFLRAIFPSSLRRGGCAVNEMSRSILCPRRRGGYARRIYPFPTTPSAPLTGGFAKFCLMSRPPSSARRGLAFTETIHIFVAAMPGYALRTGSAVFQCPAVSVLLYPAVRQCIFCRSASLW